MSPEAKPNLDSTGQEEVKELRSKKQVQLNFRWVQVQTLLDEYPTHRTLNINQKLVDLYNAIKQLEAEIKDEQTMVVLSSDTPESP